MADSYRTESTLMHLGTTQSNEDEWLHIHYAADMSVMLDTDGEDTTSEIKNIYVMDVQNSPPYLALMGRAAFSALVGFDIEQTAALGLLGEPEKHTMIS